MTDAPTGTPGDVGRRAKEPDERPSIAWEGGVAEPMRLSLCSNKTLYIL